jgi:hypothetical protein
MTFEKVTHIPHLNIKNKNTSELYGCELCI